MELVRYFHLNPLRAGIVDDFKTLVNYSFSGHWLLAGAGECYWQDATYVLRQFGKSVIRSRKGYLAYINEGIAMGRRPELVGVD